MSKPKQFLFAYNEGEAIEYRNKHALSREEYPYIASIMTLAGMQGIPHTRIGNWHVRSDVWEIDGNLDDRNSIEENAL